MLLIKKYKSWALRSKLLGERVPDSETKAHIGEFYKKKKEPRNCERWALSIY